MSDLRLPDMAQHLRELLRQVPLALVTTCRALAEALGDPGAADWVGHFLLHHPHDGARPIPSFGPIASAVRRPDMGERRTVEKQRRVRFLPATVAKYPPVGPIVLPKSRRRCYVRC